MAKVLDLVLNVIHDIKLIQYLLSRVRLNSGWQVRYKSCISAMLPISAPGHEHLQRAVYQRKTKEQRLLGLLGSFHALLSTHVEGHRLVLYRNCCKE